MTDARFPERWLNDRRYMSLSGPDFRAFVLTLTWSVASRTDGAIKYTDVDLMNWLTPEIAERLAANDVFVPIDDGWLIDGFAVTQTSKRQLDALDRGRAKDAERKREERLQRKLTAQETAGQQVVRPDVQRDDLRTRTRTRPLPDQPLAKVEAPTGRCFVSDCGRPPRHGLRTCFDHAASEFAS